ncbi:hypothetical protein ACFX2G_032861 [Malus domestica]|nr:E3 ubiquitin-protein ligase SIRP1-like [Malus domestica]
MQSFNPNHDHGDDYNIVVTVDNSGHPDDHLLSKFPQVSFSWEVFQSYHVTGTTSSIRDPVATLTFDIHLLPSQDIVSNMLRNIQIPFPLDRLRWKTWRGVKHTDDKPLNDVDDMPLPLDKPRWKKGRGRKKLVVRIKIEKQISTSNQQYDTINIRRDLEHKLKDFLSVLSRSGLLQQPRDEVHSQASMRSAMAYWNEIKSRAAAAGLINDINSASTSHRGNYGVEDVNALLLEISIVMEAASGEYQSSQSRPKPASKVFVEALDAFKITDGVNHVTNAELCVVCLEKILSGEEVTPLPCSHMFHAKCVVQWFKSGHTCPVCRFECPTD